MNSYSLARIFVLVFSSKFARNGIHSDPLDISICSNVIEILIVQNASTQNTYSRYPRYFPCSSQCRYMSVAVKKLNARKSASFINLFSYYLQSPPPPQQSNRKTRRVGESPTQRVGESPILRLGESRSRLLNV